MICARCLFHIENNSYTKTVYTIMFFLFLAYCSPLHHKNIIQLNQNKKFFCCSRSEPRNSITITFFATFNEKLSPAAGLNQNIVAFSQRNIALRTKKKCVVRCFITLLKAERRGSKLNFSCFYGSFRKTLESCVASNLYSKSYSVQRRSNVLLS